jgi:hypothetical protein
VHRANCCRQCCGLCFCPLLHLLDSRPHPPAVLCVPVTCLAPPQQPMR